MRSGLDCGGAGRRGIEPDVRPGAPGRQLTEPQSEPQGTFPGSANARANGIRPHDLLGITGVSPRVDGTGTHTDFTRPGVLVYEPQADGSHELVAIENPVLAQAWQAAGNTEPPTSGENQDYYMVDNPLTEIDEAHGFTPHDELRIWLYRHNPAGTFMQFNTQVSCPETN